ncbi:SNF2-related protein [Aquidulcibacter paucihalophilus]|uniref:SNF2-related protein n=1 Tax=Aquidulcibacter paucihalophilus TaxID=1978549 RepID=UPI000A19187F|nr:SNF2-related protein [Aquidulcibacter paucihalophilus]
MITNYHAKYFAYDLTRRAPSGAAEQLSMALFDASVDLNPHQIEAAIFATQSPLSEGVILADEVGLGKTIEAGIILCQRWAERRRRLLIVAPASIRQQWVTELKEKFNLPAAVLDTKSYKQAKSHGNAWPFDQPSIVVVSYQFAARLKEEVRQIDWDLVVIDEAHKLRNAYRPSNKTGQSLRWALEGRRKVLLTATPLQNSLMELYGLSSFIDPDMFGDPNAFRSRFMSGGGNLDELRLRLADFCKRTLRRQVLEYVRYTARRAITQPFKPTDAEEALYRDMSAFLQSEAGYAIPQRQRHLTTLIMRKLLASSSYAIAGTMDVLANRLTQIRNGTPTNEDWLEDLLEDEELDTELLDELEAAGEDEDTAPEGVEPVRSGLLRTEMETVARLSELARGIETDSKSHALLKGLSIGFENQAQMGAEPKALIFTESKRTQDYLRRFLEANGYAGQIVCFSGTNNGPEAKAIHEKWLKANAGEDKVTGSRVLDMRTALIDAFRNDAKIMIATEAAAEGVNLQFCSMVINYDLPWNPQRIEQRIGRCHRYGQKHDVIVINFLNETNAADIRVHELLRDKLNLFSGMFGASDEVLGTLESGVDFEKRVNAIYQECRTPEEITAAFDALQKELEDSIAARMDDTRRALLEHFDEDVHARLKIRLEDTRAQLDRVGQRFWDVTTNILSGRAQFEPKHAAFNLLEAPQPDIDTGRYHLVSRQTPEPVTTTLHGHLYRLSHPLGEWVLNEAKSLPTPMAQLNFEVAAHKTRNATLEGLAGRHGWLQLDLLTVQSFESEEYLVFSGVDDQGKSLDQETCERLFQAGATLEVVSSPPADASERIDAGAKRAIKSAFARAIEANNAHFTIAREKLERWADDMVAVAERQLKDTKEQIKAARRLARTAATLEEEHAIQLKLQELERKQRKQRQEIFSKEDEIAERRDLLIAGLQKKLQQGQSTQTLFRVAWRVS